MEALRFKPVAYYRLDDTSPFQDYSGYGRTASVTGSETHGLALTADATYSQRFYTGNYATLTAPVYTKGREDASFSLSAVVYPIVFSTGSEQQVVSHGGQYDGITIEGTTVHFTTTYVNTGRARCSFDV